MTTSASNDPRYPIGPFQPDRAPTETRRETWISHITSLPDDLRTALAGLTDPQLDTPYRVGGWSLRQITHHVADEHVNAFAYFKMALTEDDPAIKKYNEPLWAGTIDANQAPPEFSLTLLTGLHARWALLLRSLAPATFQRCYLHPTRGRVSLEEGLQLYAWHGQHHVAQIMGLRSREGW